MVPAGQEDGLQREQHNTTDLSLESGGQQQEQPQQLQPQQLTVNIPLQLQNPDPG